MKKVFVVVMHLLTIIITQDLLWTLIIWYYDYSLVDCLFYAVPCLILLPVDYLLEKRYYAKAKPKHMWILHTIIDALFIIPSLFITTHEFFRVDIVGATVIIIDVLLIAKRILLIKNIKDQQKEP